MKKCIVSIFILCCISAAAQDNNVTQTLPELQEWYSIKGGGISPMISYLPGFDSVGGGLNAITHKRSNSDPVFYNRFPFDTASQFQWKPDGGEIVVQIDFNNDGIHDYVDYRGRLYTGSKKGEKPNPEPIRTLTSRIADRNFIHDFNNDSYPDVMVRNGAARVEILFGNKELSQMKRSTKPYPRAASFIGGYTNEEGKPRFILYANEDYTEGFYLYGIRTANKGDSTEIFLDELDKIEIEKENKNDPQKYWELLSALYQENKKSIPFFNIYEAPKIDGTRPQPKGFTIENDKFTMNRDDSPLARIGSNLGCSVDGDNVPDFFSFDQISENNQLRRVYKLYSGNPQFSDNKPVAFFYEPKCINSSMRCIGDINGDRINDIGFSCGSDIFAIYLGLDWRKVSVNEVAEYNSFKIHQNIPNPVQKDRKTLLPVSLKKAGNYSLTLYDIQGNTIKQLFSGEVSEGEHKIPLDLMGLSAGMYVVKMSNGSISRERAIMIGE